MDKNEYLKGLSEDQRSAFDFLLSGSNVFLTGSAGTGKSFLIDRFIQYSRSKGKNILVTAYTGIAAQNIGGATLNRTFSLDFAPKTYMPSTEDIPPVLRSTDILIIDEISVVRIDMFDYITALIHLSETTFKKKIQLILVGDFYQLPPVISSKDLALLESYYSNKIGKGFAFRSANWAAFGIRTIKLKQVIRQTDADFAKALDYIRTGDIRGNSWIKAHSASDPIPNAFSLVSKKDETVSINQKFLSSLDPASEHIYYMQKCGDVNDDDIRADETLILRKGAVVMVLENDHSGRDMYVNGSYGTVTELFENSVNVKLNSGIVNFARYTWDSYEYEESNDPEQNAPCARIVGQHSQIPLKLAWAISIHKSQGQTYDKLNVDLSGTWEDGHVYTALSRIRDIRNLYIHGIIPTDAVHASDEVKHFYADTENNAGSLRGPCCI